MSQEKSEQNNAYLQEIRIALQNRGFSTSEPTDDFFQVSLEGQSLCKVMGTGSVRYSKSDVITEGQNDALHQVISTAYTVSEYMRLMEEAPVLKADGLDEHYKLLADYNGTVLVGHPTSFGVQFITRDWCYGHAAVTQGHQMAGNYEAAKQDFAVRSGLIDKRMLFSQDQLTEIYRCIQDTLDHQYDITFDQENMLKDTQEQIIDIVPDLDQRVQRAMDQEETTFSHPMM